MSRPLYIAEAWGHRERWHRFVFPTTRSRNFTQALALRLARGRVVLVQHGDLECRFANPPRTGDAATFYDEPWLNPASAHAYGRGHPAAPTDTPCFALETDLTDGDLGRSAEKLRDLLEQLAATTTPRDRVLLSSTCLPSKLGDDPRIGELLRRSPIASQVIYNAPDVDQSVPPIIEQTRRALRSEPPGQQSAPACAVNLVGFPRAARPTGIRRLLRAAGVSIHVELLPDIELDRLGAFRLAQLSVLFPERHYDAVYRQLFDGLPLRLIAPAPPYGLAASQRWFAAIAAELGRQGPMERAWRDFQRRTRTELERLRRQLAGRTVGFIGTRSELRSLADPRQTQGVPLFAMLDELGVGVEWLELGRPSRSRTPQAHRAYFRTPGELDRRMAEARSELFYSDVAWDRRVTRNGKVPISLSRFQLGPEGFLQTARELAGACRLPFYRDYREYLP